MGIQLIHDGWLDILSSILWGLSQYMNMQSMMIDRIVPGHTPESGYTMVSHLHHGS